ncbi:MAG TPA: toll/interleukin-1 receptor domain-containing protein [Casimicrobiaceae bacterium]|jgi:hypothetical protein
MRVFISYASEHRDLAERLALGLRNDGNSVFFDREALPAGASFDDRIRSAIGRCNLFVFLISKESLRKGAYAQTELNMAQQRWPNPAGKVLPVLGDEVTIEELPPYLRAVSALETKGDLVAEVLQATASLARERRVALAIRFVAVATTLVVASVAGWGWLVFHRQLAVENIHVAAVSQKSSEGDPEFRFDVKLKNRGSEAITIVDIGPNAESDQATFSGTSTEWFNLNPQEEREVTFDVALQGNAKAASFRWRLCWGYVRTEDRYYELESGKANVDMFMGRYRREGCGGWRAWTQER